jgi:two-component system NarL family response regulator
MYGQLSEAEAAKIREAPAPPEEFHHHGLTRRDRDVLRELLTGAANKEIGGRLGISEGSAKQYVCGLFPKLHVNNRQGAALWAQRHPELIGREPPA